MCGIDGRVVTALQALRILGGRVTLGCGALTGLDVYAMGDPGRCPGLTQGGLTARGWLAGARCWRGVVARLRGLMVFGG